MGNSDLILQWSKLIPLKKNNIEEYIKEDIGGVFRISKKDTDDKFYVVFVGSNSSLKSELIKLVSDKENNFLNQNGEFSFRYAPIKDEETRKAIEKQMYKQYAPEYNPKEPISALEIKVNLS